MKSIAKLMFGAVLLTAFGTLPAQENLITFNSLEDWNKSTLVTNADGAINIKRTFALFSKKFPVDPNKKYTVKVFCRAVNMKNEKDKSLIYVGFSVFDKNGREFFSYNCNTVPGTFTEVVENAPKGATVLKIKDGSKFRKKVTVIVTGAKADLSDLPNFNFFANVKGVASKNGVWEVTLEKPLVKDIPAGTKIREHARGGYLYSAGVKAVGKDWTVMSGSIKGMKKGVYIPQCWPAGTAYAKIVILANYGKKNLDTQIKDVTVTVE